MKAFKNPEGEILAVCAECCNDYAYEIGRSWDYKVISAQEAYDNGILPKCALYKRFSFQQPCRKAGYWDCQKPASATVLTAARVQELGTEKTHVFNTCMSCQLPDWCFSSLYGINNLMPHEAESTGADAKCSSCGMPGIWRLPIGEISVSISQKWAHAKPTVKIEGLDKINSEFDSVQIQIFRNYEGVIRQWDSICNPLIKRPKSGFKAVESVTLKSGNDLRNYRLYDGEYFVKVVGCVRHHGNDKAVQPLAQSETFTVKYRWTTPRAHKVDMIVYRVVGGDVFGGDRTQHEKFSKGTFFTEGKFFVTPHQECAKDIVAYCDGEAFAYDGSHCSWAKVAIIRATKVRAAHPHEKKGHDDRLDRDEMILVAGQVIDLVNLDRKNDYRFPDEVAVNA